MSIWHLTPYEGEYYSILLVGDGPITTKGIVAIDDGRLVLAPATLLGALGYHHGGKLRIMFRARCYLRRSVEGLYYEQGQEIDEWAMLLRVQSDLTRQQIMDLFIATGQTGIGMGSGPSRTGRFTVARCEYSDHIIVEKERLPRREWERRRDLRNAQSW